MKDNRSYYDEFSNTYEAHRHQGYHAWLDEIETNLIKKYITPNSSVLEAGCGTGLILNRLAPHAARAVGVDLSAGMLSYAAKRQLQVVQAPVTNLPFADATFDVVYSCKVLAHVENIQKAMQEMARVLKPGGVLITEFYNPYSIRGLIKKTKRPTAISDKTHDESVYVRYDSLAKINTYLPSSLQFETVYGIRIFTLFSHMHRWPVIGSILRFFENTCAHMPGLRRLGGFLAVVARKRHMLPSAETK